MKSYDITIDLKQKIVNGAYKPGAPIPRREELLSCYDASKGTVQSAINQLVEEGFLEAHGAKGMFVSNNPPHLYKIGITIPKQVKETGTIDLFWRNIINEASKLEKNDSGYSFKFYHGIGMDEAANDWDALLEDIKKHTVSGIILLEHWRIPEIMFRKITEEIPVVIFERKYLPYENLYSMQFNYEHLIEMSVERFRDIGIKRTAVITNAELPPDYLDSYTKGLKQYGMPYSDEQVQAVGLGHYEKVWATHITKLLFSKSRNDIPEGLLILNQNLTPHIFKALEELEIIPGKDLKVITHSGYPVQTRRREGVELIGFDDREALMRAIELLNQHRLGIKQSQEIMLDAKWIMDI